MTATRMPSGQEPPQRREATPASTPSSANRETSSSPVPGPAWSRHSAPWSGGRGWIYLPRTGVVSGDSGRRHFELHRHPGSEPVDLERRASQSCSASPTRESRSSIHASSTRSKVDVQVNGRSASGGSVSTAGLAAESRRLFRLACEAAGEGGRGLDFALYGALARCIGWPRAGRLAVALDRLRARQDGGTIRRRSRRSSVVVPWSSAPGLASAVAWYVYRNFVAC